MEQLSIWIKNQRISEMYVTKKIIQSNPLLEFKSEIHCNGIYWTNTSMVVIMCKSLFQGIYK